MDGLREALRHRAESLPQITLDAREQADLELIATGAASPLIGFLGLADYRSVLERLRLADGTVWPLPFTLAVEDRTRDLLRAASEAALGDATGRVWGVLRIQDVYVRDPLEESRAVYGTEDPSHPGVAYLLARPRTLLGGSVPGVLLGARVAHVIPERALRTVLAVILIGLGLPIAWPGAFTHVQAG